MKVRTALITAFPLQARFAESFEAAVSALGAVENEDLSDDEEHLNILNRIQVLQWACLFGNQLCRRLTTERLNDPSAISLDLRSTVLCAGIRGANASVWNYIYERSLVEEDSSLKSSLTNALGCSENEEILNRSKQIIFSVLCFTKNHFL